MTHAASLKIRFLASLPRLHASQPRSRQSGFAYFLALFLMAAMLAASTAVMLDMRTQGRRQREDEMMWRGKQVVIGIKRYYRRTGHYPQNLEELEKGVAIIHFVRRAALVDPMNKDGDGKWRFIYTNPTGQIIGSVRYATLQQMAILDMNGGKIPHPPGSDSSSDTSDQDSSNSSSTSSSSSSSNCPPSGLGPSNQVSAQSTSSGLTPGFAPGASTLGNQIQAASPQPSPLAGSFSLGPTQAGAAGPCAVQGAMGMAPAALQALMQLKPTGPVDNPVIGGFLIGVGSTVDRASVKVHKGGKKYKDWEFIYNQIEEQALAFQQGMGSGTMGLMGLGQANGLAGPGTSSGGIGSTPTQTPPMGQPPQSSQPQQQR